MSLFDLEAKITFDDKDYVNGIRKAEDKAESFASKLKSGLSVAGKVTGAVLGSATAAAGALTKAAVESYSDFEQLNGGIDTLFNKAGSSWADYAEKMKAAGKMTRDNAEEVYAEYEELAAGADLVRKNAGQAFRTAGLSMNEYMETATGAAAALINSLEGDTVAAAKYADMSIRDMSDNANKMGTSMESLQFAYSGFAKGNFTMLDNLKLGFSGSKEGMQQLLDKANELNAAQGKHTNYQIDNYADIVEAIHTVQDSMGIAGATEAEAMGTIEGSIKMLKASWKDLVMTIATEDEIDFTDTLDNFIVSAEAAINNLLPRISTALIGVGSLIEDLAPIIAEKVPAIVSEVLPSVVSAAQYLVEGLITGLQTAAPELIPTIVELFFSLIDFVTSMLPEVATLGFDIIFMLGQGIAENLPALIARLPEIILGIITYFTENLPQFLEMGFQILDTLAFGILDTIPYFVDMLPPIIDALIDFIVQNFPLIITKGGELLGKLIIGILGAIPQIATKIPQVISALVRAFEAGKSQLRQSGKYLLEGLWNGISDKIGWLKTKIYGVVETIKSWFTGKEGFDEHSPSKWSEKVFKYLMEGGGNGTEKGTPALMKKIKNSTDKVKDYFEEAEFAPIDATISQNSAVGGPNSGVGFGGINLSITISNFVNNSDKDLRELAETLSEYMTDEILRRLGAYA